MRRDGWQYRILLALSGLTLVLVVVYLFLVQNDRSIQAEINQRQQFINQSIQLGRINDALIRTIAAAAIDKKDDKLRDLLAENGITINTTVASPPAVSSGPSDNRAAPAGKRP